MEINGTNYAKLNKDTLNIVVGDENEEIELHIFLPTKSIHEQLVEIAEYVDKAAVGEIDESFSPFDCLPTIAEAMSHNKEARKITPEMLEAWQFDMSCIADFIGLYIYFIAAVADEKNSHCPTIPTTKVMESGSTDM